MLARHDFRVEVSLVLECMGCLGRVLRATAERRQRRAGASAANSCNAGAGRSCTGARALSPIRATGPRARRSA